MTANIDALIQQAADQYNLDPGIFRAQLTKESNLNPNAVNTRSGAAGIAQFMPGTAAGFGIDPMDPTQAIPAAAAYMRQNLNKFGGDYAHALAAYNWGPGNVANHGLAAAPPETQNYVATILGGNNPPIPVPPMPPPGGPAPAPAPAPAPDPTAPGGAILPTMGDTLADAFMRAAKQARGAT